MQSYRLPVNKVAPVLPAPQPGLYRTDENITGVLGPRSHLQLLCSTSQM